MHFCLGQDDTKKVFKMARYNKWMKHIFPRSPSRAMQLPLKMRTWRENGFNSGQESAALSLQYRGGLGKYLYECRGELAKLGLITQGVVSLSPASVTAKIPLLKKATENHIIKSTSMEENSDPKSLGY